jgi:hypothetical protein
MALSPTEDYVYAQRATNIVLPSNPLDDLGNSVSATAKSQHAAKLAAELTARQSNATAQGATGTIKRAAK